MKYVQVSLILLLILGKNMEYLRGKQIILIAFIKIAIHTHLIRRIIETYPWLIVFKDISERAHHNHNFTNIFLRKQLHVLYLFIFAIADTTST